MYHADPHPTVPSLKMFPRLAVTSTPSQSGRAGRPEFAKAVEPGARSGDNRRRLVRQRLLRMILDNEKVRRDEQRPTAG